MLRQPPLQFGWLLPFYFATVYEVAFTVAICSIVTNAATSTAACCCCCCCLEFVPAVLSVSAGFAALALPVDCCLLPTSCWCCLHRQLIVAVIVARSLVQDVRYKKNRTFFRNNQVHAKQLGTAYNNLAPRSLCVKTSDDEWAIKSLGAAGASSPSPSPHYGPEYSIAATSLIASKPIPPHCHHCQHPSPSAGSELHHILQFFFSILCTQDFSFCLLRSAWGSLIQDV